VNSEERGEGHTLYVALLDIELGKVLNANVSEREGISPPFGNVVFV
jgi:hypothetical protein